MKKFIYTKPLVSETNFEAETFFMSGTGHEGYTPAPLRANEFNAEDYE